MKHAPFIFGLILSALSGLARAEESALSLDDAVRIALTRQPRIEAQEARARAEREEAIAERQLPDPRLMAGIKDFPVEGAAAGTFTGDDFTMIEVGLSQEFPRAEKRRLRGERRLHQAEAAEVMAELLRREIRRDAGLAWLEVFLPQQSQALVESLRREADLLAQTAEIGFRSGRLPQSEVLSAQVAAALLDDRAAALRQQVNEARGALSRWVGESASAPLAGTLPDFPQPPPLPELLQQLEKHPHLLALAREEDVARADIALAEQDYLPDWSVDAYYGNRPAFADFVGLRVNVDLPFFTANRQDRRLQARREQATRAAADRDDALRMQVAEARADYAAREELSARLRRYDERILPAARDAVAAAQAAYGAGASRLDAVLRQRQALLDAELQRLAIAVDAARAQRRLSYLFE